LRLGERNEEILNEKNCCDVAMLRLNIPRL
jgi:hypothetical protein